MTNVDYTLANRKRREDAIAGVLRAFGNIEMCYGGLVDLNRDALRDQEMMADLSIALHALLSAPKPGEK